MKSSRIISLILALAIAITSGITLLVLELIVSNQLIFTVFLILIITYLVSYGVIEHLFYRDVNEIILLLEELKNGSRVEEVQINRGKLRLPTFKKLYKKLYSHVLSKQYEVDEMARIAAFRKEFIADVSHELKTPIFAAQGFVHTLLDGAIDDKNVRTRFLEKAAKSLDGLDLLVQDLLILSHIEIGETKMQFEYFDLKGLGEEVLEQFEGKRENRSLQLSTNITDNKPIIVYADWLRIKQVLNNLVSNAIKYSKDDGQIKLKLFENGNKIDVSILDNGEGIPKNDLERIFERFYRVDKSRSREKGGTGLGLAIVKHIIEGHHTKMEVSSDLGHGTNFSFSLPKGKDEIEAK